MWFCRAKNLLGWSDLPPRRTRVVAVEVEPGERTAIGEARHRRGREVDWGVLVLTAVILRLPFFPCRTADRGCTERVGLSGTVS